MAPVVSRTTGKLTWRRASPSASCPTTSPTALSARSRSGPTTRNNGAGAGRSYRVVEAQLSAGTRRRLTAQVIGGRRHQFACKSADELQYLRSRQITPLTQARYTKAHTLFVTYARLRGFDLMNMKNIDMALFSYLDDLFFQGKQIWEARYAVYGTIWLKQLARHCPHTLPRAREALLGCGKAAPEVVGDPLPWEASLFIAQHMADSGTPTGLAGARAVLVGFDGYLRPAEILGIRKSDVTINRPALPHHHAHPRAAAFDPGQRRSPAAAN